MTLKKALAKEKASLKTTYHSKSVFFLNPNDMVAK